MEARIMLKSEFARLATLNANQEEIDVIERIFNVVKIIKKEKIEF